MFLMREMMAEGYRVKLASNSEIVLQIVFTPGAVDLLIIDPDLAGMELTNFLNVLGERIPPLPIVFHIHQRYPEASYLIEKIPFCIVIEKEGDSVEQIKAVVGKLLTTSGSSTKERGHSKCRERTTP
jgi:DNA-binding NtrC family response regulator